MLRRKGLLEVLLRLTVRQVLRGRGGVVGRTQEQGRSWSQSRLHSNWRLSVFRHLSQQNSDRWRIFFFRDQVSRIFFPQVRENEPLWIVRSIFVFLGGSSFGQKTIFGTSKFNFSKLLFFTLIQVFSF